MLLNILRYTPPWVWGLHAALLGRNWALLALTFVKASPTTILANDPALHR